MPTEWKLNYMVVVPDGRIGMLVELPSKGLGALIQFGSSGPFQRFSTSALRYATTKEIKEEGLDGIGLAADMEF